jgi:hypothetical protein
MISKGPRRIRRRPICDSALSSLRTAILEGTFQARERLIEIDLAHQLGTSRGPMTEAFTAGFRYLPIVLALIWYHQSAQMMSDNGWGLHQ